MGGCGIRISDEAPQKKTRKTMSMEDYLDLYEKRKILQEKRKNVPRVPETELHVKICGATEIDENTKDPMGNRRIYFVYGWVIPEDGLLTSLSGTLPNPEWNETYRLKLGKLNYDMYLNIEVYRYQSIVGPETSNRRALVGRGQLLVPKEIGRREIKRCGLVTLEGLPAGFIYIELELVLSEQEKKKYFLT